jgi:hypothetical protein
MVSKTMTGSKQTIRLLVSVALLAAAANPAAAELLVTGARGVGVAVGDRLPDNHVFKLPAHSKLQLLKTQDNSPYVMRGPFEGTLSNFIGKCSGILASTRSYCKESGDDLPLGGTRGSRRPQQSPDQR